MGVLAAGSQRFAPHSIPAGEVQWHLPQNCNESGMVDSNHPEEVLLTGPPRWVIRDMPVGMSLMTLHQRRSPENPTHPLAQQPTARRGSRTSRTGNRARSDGGGVGDVDGDGEGVPGGAGRRPIRAAANPTLHASPGHRSSAAWRTMGCRSSATHRNLFVGSL